MADNLTAMHAALAHVEVAKAASLQAQLKTRGPHMSADAREIICFLVFAHQDAAKELLAAAQEGCDA